MRQNFAEKFVIYRRKSLILPTTQVTIKGNAATMPRDFFFFSQFFLHFHAGVSCMTAALLLFQELLSLLPSMHKGEPTWLELKMFGAGWWINNINILKRTIEKVSDNSSVA